MIRDEYGAIIVAKAWYESVSVEVEVVEALTLLKSLQMVEEMGLQAVWFESDAEVVVKKIHLLNLTHSYLGVIYAEVVSLICRFNILGLHFVKRVGNRVPYCVAAHALSFASWTLGVS